MITLVYHPNFLKSARALPAAQQRKLPQPFERLRDNPYHQSLRTKRLTVGRVLIVPYYP